MSSSNAPALPAPPPRRLLTPEASNVLGWWWLAIVTTLVLLCSMWPSIFPENATGGLSSTSGYLLVIIIGVLVAVGSWCSYEFANGKPRSARIMRLIAMIGLVLGLVGVGYFLYSVAFGPAGPSGETFWGPSGVLAGITWTMIIILPFIFGLTFIFGLMNDAVDEWFNPPVSFTPTDASLRIDPRTAAIMAGGVSASMADEELMGELSEAMSLTDKKARFGETDRSIEVIGSSEEDVSVEVIGGTEVHNSNDSMEELAALERALTQDASKKGKDKKKEKKKEEKLEAGPGDSPLKVDDDFKL